MAKNLWKTVVLGGVQPTCWLITYLLLGPPAEVLQELEWDDLATSEWKTLEAVWNLLHPFALFTSLIQGEYYTTISATIMDLNLHLEELMSM